MRTVDIVLATYKPDENFFEKLLVSLNSQIYPYINLIIRDDSADPNEFEKICMLTEKNITAFNYKIFKNDKNLGSNKTFEELTKNASADYIAYCDQDDIWEKEKIIKLVEAIEREAALLSYSDLSIIDDNDILVADSFKDIHKRLKHVEGDGLFPFFLRRNSVTGCTMLIQSGIAKKAIPFCIDYYVHDHWLALFSSSVGKIAYVPEALIRYRIHSGNQIGASMLNDIEDRDDYYRKKLLKEREKFNFLLANYNFNNDCEEAIKSIFQWTEERIAFFEKKNVINSILMLKKIKDDYQLILLEIAINFLPNLIGKKVINKVKK